MYNRFLNTKKNINVDEQYSEILERKNLDSITQYSTYNFKESVDLSGANIIRLMHKVEPYEKLYMISQKYYNSPDLGWLICYTNRISSELKIKEGDTLFIYLPLNQILKVY